ncbi:BTB/POZ domain-containing protein 6-like isoform X2 [Haliotis rubra]|uniref:BTB/POZ domain-containing protein 6-like isoform X2 n=1 Tax=Haliotis rubra TaxID=36100 RepID=UPI001EE5D767|nr:BTB/POZ domain-containing protein 6-like isoform X2 [Haliotis rubra]
MHFYAPIVAMFSSKAAVLYEHICYICVSHRPANCLCVCCLTPHSACLCSSCSIDIEADTTQHFRQDTVVNSEDTVIGCNRRMLDQQLACDVKFKVGQSKSPVGAHKYVLGARSDVFFTMFNGSIPQSDDVDVPDIELEPFKIFLRYLYCDEILVAMDNVLSVLYCGKKYNVQSLLTKCVDFIKNMMSVDNVCSLFEQAHFFDEEQLYQSCLSFIHQQGTEVLQTTGFLLLSRACVSDVISSNSLACEESVVFEAMLRWAEAECKRQHKPVHDSNLREILGELLFKIRFSLLDISYYSSYVSTRKILTDAEKVFLFQSISGTAVGTMKFNGKKRTQYWDLLQ